MDSQALAVYYEILQLLPEGLDMPRLHLEFGNVSIFATKMNAGHYGCAKAA